MSQLEYSQDAEIADKRCCGFGCLQDNLADIHETGASSPLGLCLSRYIWVQHSQGRFVILDQGSPELWEHDQH